MLKELHSTDIYATAPPSRKTLDQLSLVSHLRWTYIYSRTKEEEEIEELREKEGFMLRPAVIFARTGQHNKSSSPNSISFHFLGSNSTLYRLININNIPIIM